MLRLVVYPSLGAAGVSVEVVDKRRRLVGKEFHIFVLPIEIQESCMGTIL